MKRNYIAPNTRCVEIELETLIAESINYGADTDLQSMDVKEEFQNNSFDSKSIWDKEW